MEPTQSPRATNNPANHLVQQEISLLDLLVTLAENAKLLIIGSLLVGFSVLGISFLVPQTFESVAVLQAEQVTASLMTTAAVLDPVIVKMGLAKNESPEQARLELRQSIKTAVGRNDKLLTLTVAAPSPQQAQAIAMALLQQTYIQSSPQGSVRARLETQLAEAQGRLKSAGTVAAGVRKNLESASTTAANSSDLARGYADLLNAAAAAQLQIGLLETQLEGLTDAQLIQSPTLPEKPSQPKKALLAIGATLGSGFLLMLFVFIRQALRNTAQDAVDAGKLVRIRRAFGLK